MTEIALSDADRALLGQGAAVSEATAGFLGLLDRLPGVNGGQREALDLSARKLRARAERLNRAVRRPMCVGVFGPSQSGKSYLISALARRGTRPLMADFQGRQVDFIAEINPAGERESTGVVTRFSIRPPTAPPAVLAAAPLELRLLSQMDVVKIIANAFFADCDPAQWPPLTPEDIDHELGRLAPLASASPVGDGLEAEDIYDLQAYLERHFKGSDRVRALRAAYWPRAADLAPRLAPEYRARLFALIWGGVEALSGLYLRLYEALRGLGFPDTAFATLDALLPRERSIIDVATLKGLGQDGNGNGDGNGAADRLTLIGAGGRTAALPRPEVSALTAELRITVAEKPWDFFDHTDLLDFPGARSREQIADLGKYLETGGALQTLFLRGKVAYLFQRYNEEQELTSMLLCIAPGPQEVKSLPEMVNDWIAATHGATPAERANQKTALFLVLTKFDMQFEEKAGQDKSPVGRWTTRLHSSLLDPFGRFHDWPQQWDDKGPFRNVLWLRNPNFKVRALFDYTPEGTEIGLRPDAMAGVETLFRGYLDNPDVRRHFAEPERAWQAAMTPNDGGISYLAACLEPVCDPTLKSRQIAGQMTRLRGQMRDLIAPFHAGDDQAAELEKRRALAQRVARALVGAAQHQRLGLLLARLHVELDTVEDLFHRLDRGEADSGAHAAARRAAAAVPASLAAGAAAPSKDMLLAALGLDTAPAGEDQAALPTVAADHPVPADQAALLAERAVGLWLKTLVDLSGDPHAAEVVHLPATDLADLVQEMGTGARRLGLEARIADAIRAAAARFIQFSLPAAVPARLAGAVINRFVNHLGMDDLPPERRPTITLDGTPRPVFMPHGLPTGTAPRIGPTPEAHDSRDATEWIRAFMAMVEANATFKDDRQIDLEVNATLGRLLAGLDTGLDIGRGGTA